MIPTVLVSLVALLLDRMLGEPSRCHPLAGLGWCADRLEERLNPPGRGRVLMGALAVLMLLTPLLVLALLASNLPTILWGLVSVVVLWIGIGYRSLDEHGMAVYRPLASGDLTGAREQVAMMVSRDPRALDETGVATAATESLLENGADAVFASLFWFVLAGLPGLVLHRTVNTLDAMWGYRSERFNRFGRVAARLDDILNWVPARLTALSYAAAGNGRRALRCWRRQARRWDSPNAGPVMAAGAGALGLRLGGTAHYATGRKERPLLGEGAPATAESIPQATALIRRALWLWVCAGLLLAMMELWIAW